jgi:hypothetical protein
MARGGQIEALEVSALILLLVILIVLLIFLNHSPFAK